VSFQHDLLVTLRSTCVTRAESPWQVLLRSPDMLRTIVVLIKCMFAFDKYIPL
jgi:hypothetical protein